jgi:DNA-directed RNA polymerase specialized sigma24 family protein|tara:strand:- start:24790 stop:25119 length:330 start_codon:yes stop_codon:yes gene_type:complete
MEDKKPKRTLNIFNLSDRVNGIKRIKTPKERDTEALYALATQMFKNEEPEQAALLQEKYVTVRNLATIAQLHGWTVEATKIYVHQAQRALEEKVNFYKKALLAHSHGIF